MSAGDRWMTAMAVLMAGFAAALIIAKIAGAGLTWAWATAPLWAPGALAIGLALAWHTIKLLAWLVVELAFAPARLPRKKDDEVPL